MDQGSDDEDGSLLLNIILILILIIINGFFAAAELAVLSANKNKIIKFAEGGNRRAKAVLKLKNQENRFLSTIQVGITLAGFFSSATGAAKLAEPAGNILTNLNIPYGSRIAFFVITILLSYITLVFGELFPKRIARRTPEKIAMFVARPVLLMKVMATPFVKLLSASTNFIVKITRIEANLKEDKVSEEDIKSLLESGVTEGSIDTDEQKMIEGIFKFDDLDADDVMTPRVDVFMINIDDDSSEYLDQVIKGKYSRIPVYKENLDNIIGVLHIKDLLICARKVGFENINIGDIIRKPYFVTDRTKINVLYKKMQEKNTHIVFLTDEFGGFRGIVTLEDIIEEIMGNIYDEYDDDLPEIIKIDDNSYLVEGSTSIQYVNRELDTDFDEDDPDFDTIGGLIISLINRIPNEDEEVEVECDNIQLKVKKMDNNRIEQVLLQYNQSEEKPL